MPRKNAVATLFAAVVFGAAAAGFVGCTSLLGDFEVATTDNEGGTGGKKANGDTCSVGSDCNSSFCTDGVCCESVCSGTCESCNLGADKGKCVPVPDGQDPEKECKPEPRPDAGTNVEEPDAEAPPDDGGVSEAGTVDAAGVITLPEAGVTTSESDCAGSCNGARACKFPGKEKVCGTKFCNSQSEAAAYRCDTKGRCELQVEICKDYSCEPPGNECRQTCAEANDCLPTHFCNGGKCQERLSDGLACALASECKSGFCVKATPGAPTGVCCNSGCDTATFGPGASCSTGKCKCDVACGTGACRLYYRDSDNDTFGDRAGSIPTTAVVGCDNAAPPAGFVADNTDCDDADANVRPNQTAYFGTPRPNGTYDYNCNGGEEKQTREFVGGSCQFCYEAGKACTMQSTCSKAGDQSRLTCEKYEDIFCLPTQPNCFSCGFSRFSSNTAGFTTKVACGASSTSYRNCGKCTAAGGGPPLTLVQNVQQLCH